MSKLEQLLKSVVFFMAKSSQISAILRERILRGDYGERLPPLRSLAAEFAVNIKTISNVIRLFASNGDVEVKHGSGIYICSNCHQGIEVETGTVSNGTIARRPLVAVLMRRYGDFFAGFFHATVAELEKNGAIPVLMPDRSTDVTRAVLDDLLERDIRALIIDGGLYQVDCDYLATHAARSPRLVFLVGRPGWFRPGAAYVLSDYYLGACRVVEHLYALGHRRILMVNSRLNKFSAAGFRYTRHHDFNDGFLQSAREHGISDTVRMWELSLNHENLGEEPHGEAFRELMTHPDRPTAIVSFIDSVCFSAIPVLSKLGLRVPRDVSLIGYHDTSLATAAPVALSSVSLRPEVIARRAAALALNGRELVCETVEPELVLRRSTAKCTTI